VNQLVNEPVWQHIAGEARPRLRIFIAVVGILMLLSVAFLLRADVYLIIGWIVVALGIAFVAGLIGAGLGPTVGSVWLIGLWWHIFPPLVGYLTGRWAVSSRYNHPRLSAWVYGSARAELLGGIKLGVKNGLLVAIIVGAIGYAVGAGNRSLTARENAR
jgi:small-conductance mechanosensitive channel